VALLTDPSPIKAASNRAPALIMGWYVLAASELVKKLFKSA
jgi:hypothetical protein